MSRAKQRTATHKERKTNLKIKNKNKQGLTWLERKRIENLKRRRHFIRYGYWE